MVLLLLPHSPCSIFFHCHWLIVGLKEPLNARQRFWKCVEKEIDIEKSNHHSIREDFRKIPNDKLERLGKVERPLTNGVIKYEQRKSWNNADHPHKKLDPNQLLLFPHSCCHCLAVVVMDFHVDVEQFKPISEDGRHIKIEKNRFRTGRGITDALFCIHLTATSINYVPHVRSNDEDG